MIYLPAFRSILREIADDKVSKEDKQSLIKRIAMGLGNCSTPIKDLLFQRVISMPKEERGEIDEKTFEAIIEREALELIILKAFKENGIDTKSPEFIENMAAITDAVYRDTIRDGNKHLQITNRTSVLTPKSRSIFSNNQYSHRLLTKQQAKIVAKLICKTDGSGEPIKTNGKYELNPRKLELLTLETKLGAGLYPYKEEFSTQYEQALFERDPLMNTYLKSSDQRPYCMDVRGAFLDFVARVKEKNIPEEKVSDFMKVYFESYVTPMLDKASKQEQEKEQQQEQSTQSQEENLNSFLKPVELKSPVKLDRSKELPSTPQTTTHKPRRTQSR